MKGEGICRLETIEALGRSFTISAVNTGVPHMAVFGEVTEEDILKYGPALERHPLFPGKGKRELHKCGAGRQHFRPHLGKGLRQDAGLRHRQLRRRGMCKYGGLYGAQC